MADVGVRAARSADVDAVVRIQVRAWQQGYRELIPEQALAELTGEEATAVWRERWADAVTKPPSPRHRVLVALAGTEVVGFTAHAPAEDDADGDDGAELLALLVDPSHARQGHGSRLLAATVDHLREDGVSTVVSWVFEADTGLRALLEPTGWAPDGTLRTLYMGEEVGMVRLHTDITEVASTPGLP
jgi:GNAT superfamily N-acetyltransferase